MSEGTFLFAEAQQFSITILNNKFPVATGHRVYSSVKIDLLSFICIKYVVDTLYPNIGI